jgi:hypothetical protein
LTSSALCACQAQQGATSLPGLQPNGPTGLSALDDVFADYKASAVNALAANAVTGISMPSSTLAIPSSLWATQIANAGDVLGLSLFTLNNDATASDDQFDVRTAIDEVFSNETAIYDRE